MPWYVESVCALVNSHELLLHDTGKAPLMIRLPLAVAGVFLLWVSAHEASSHLFGRNLGLHFTRESGSPPLGFLATLGLGLFFLSVWFLRNRIVFDPIRGEILARHSGLFGHSVRRVALLDAAGVYVKSGGRRGRRFSDIGIEFKDHRQKWLTRIYRNEEETIRRFSETLQLPILKV
jgi:hypothetical protein